MKRIVVDVHPFLLNQTIQVYNNEQLESEQKTFLYGIDKVIATMCKTENIAEVNLKGSHSFTQRIRENILKDGRFEHMNIQVNIL